MSTDILDTLTTQARINELIDHDIDDTHTRLDDIHDWYPQLATTMTHTPAATLDLTGIRGTTSRIPGGDALTMLAPYSTGYTEPDDLPHPNQIISEWANHWREATRTPTPPNARWGDHLAIIRANVPWFIRQDTSGAFRTDIRSLWHHLARLTGNHPHTEDETPQRQLEDHGHEIPDHALLTLAQAEKAFPGIRNRVDVDRSRERNRARTQNRPPEHRCDPDTKHRYLVGDLRKHYGATHFEPTLQYCPESM